MIALAELCNILLLFKHELSDIQTLHYYFPNKYHGSQIIYSFLLLQICTNSLKHHIFYETLNGKAPLKRIELYQFYLVKNLIQENQ